MAVNPPAQPAAGTLSSENSAKSGAPGFPSPNIYPPSNFFGITLPTGTGAPGTGGAGLSGGDDPTTEPGQDEGAFGMQSSALTSTGAPGSDGAPQDGGTESGVPVTYTRPGSFLSGTYQSDTVRQEVGGTQDDTQANDVGYGTGGPQLPALRGNQPTSTGAGSGRVMRGGRMNGG